MENKKVLVTENREKKYINISVSEDGENFSFIKGYNFEKSNSIHINFVNDLKNYYFKGYQIVFSKKNIQDLPGPKDLDNSWKNEDYYPFYE